MKRIACQNYVSCYVDSSYLVLQGRMESKDDRRYRRLKKLAESHGGVRAIAEKAGLKWASLDQVIKKTALPAKKDGSISPRSLGDASAEAIEDAYGLGRGWFDWPFDRVDHRRYWLLDDGERAIAQDRLSQEIDRLLALREEASRNAETLRRATYKPTKAVRKKTA